MLAPGLFIWRGIGKAGSMPRRSPDLLPSYPTRPGSAKDRAESASSVIRTAPSTQLFTAGGTFTHPELQSMAIDGLVQRVYGRSYRISGVSETPALRALSALNALPPTLRRRVTLGRATAAWVLGCAGPPDKLSLLTDHRRRTSALRPFSDAVMHEVALGPMDVVIIGGVRVTTPLRTAMDIALHGSEQTAGDILRRLALHPQLGCSLRSVALMLENVSRAPGKARALSRLQEAMDQTAEGVASVADRP